MTQKVKLPGSYYVAVRRGKQGMQLEVRGAVVATSLTLRVRVSLSYADAARVSAALRARNGGRSP